MLQSIQALIITLTFTAFTFADVFMTELTDPQNSSTAGRYVELYNNGDSAVDLASEGYHLWRWTNGNADPTSSSLKALTGTISAGGFYIVCNDSTKYEATYGLTCDQDIGTGGAADSNGDDNVALGLYDGTDSTVLDMFGVAGEDGTGTGHEFEDGRAERADSNTSASETWDEAGWNIDNDSGGGDGNQYAPEGFDPGEWIGAGQASDTCDDDSACNTGAEGSCEYPDTGYDCDGNCIGEVDCAGVCGGDSVEDCANVCGGDAAEDECGECNGDGSSCSVSVTFSVDMSIEGVVGDVKVRTSTINGEYNPSDWHVMTDDGNGTYSHTLSLLTGVTYGYNFNNSDGSGYESGSDLADCAGGNYGNDRNVTPGDSDMTLDTVCWESCEACPEDIPGCMDDSALNYDENATSDDGSCIYDWPEAANLFLSEYAEGSSNHKYLEIYNSTGGDVDLSGYSLSSCSNGCNDSLSWDYPDNVEFEAGTTISAGDVYVVCHGSADSLIQVECDQTFTYLSNGDDVFALTQIGSGAVLDIIGAMGDDPGSGWDVAGVSNGTKDHTLVRDASVSSGNGGNWAVSAGTTADDSEWVVLDQNTWDYLGSHPHEFASAIVGCMDPSATNFNPDATEQDYNEFGTSLCTYASCETIPTDMGCLWADGTSSEWWDGWWNCEGGQVCGLAEVVFELNLPDGVSGTPHVNGTYNGWCGSCYNAMSDDDGDGTWSHVQYFGAGEYHEYKFTTDGWNDQEWINGLECAVNTDTDTDYWNRFFTAGDANTSQTLTSCWGTCEEECDSAPSCGDGTCGDDEDCSSCPADCGDCPVEYPSDVTFNLDGLDECGFVSVTGTWDGWSGWGANTDTGMAASIPSGDHEFVILCVNTEGEWWVDIWGSSTVYNAPIDGSCWNGNYDYANYTLSVDGSGNAVTVSYCAGTCEETCADDDECTMGDVNDDGEVNVLDVVAIVSYIVNGGGNIDATCADNNGDGSLNVLDVVAIVSDIVGGRFDEATSAKLIKSVNGLILQSDGYVGGIQMTLKHGVDFTIELSNNAWIADYSTKNNQTILVLVQPAEGELFTTSGDFEIVDMIIANSHDTITAMVVQEFALSDAYPNPFNPSTTVELTVPEAGHVSVMVYNITGQLIAELVDSYMDVNQYQFTWEGENVPSGMYLLRAEYAGQVSTQKLMLLK